MSVRDALRGHTIHAAAAIGREDELGSLEIGKLADFAVLSGDPFAMPEDAIGEVAVEQTWISGRPQFVRDLDREVAGAPARAA